MRKLILAKMIFTLVLSFCFGAPLTTQAQTFTTLVTFNGSNGESPYYGSLIQAANGNFYGTTVSGGNIATSCSDGQGFDCGTIFELTPGGALTTFYTFCSQLNCADGISPSAGLVQASNGNFYGTTTSGGASFGGTVFEITPGGTLTTLYSFCSQLNCADGELSYAGLVQASNGNFYGTTVLGGAHGAGTVFEITPAGTLTTLYSFCSKTNCTDGASPIAGLVQATNGRLYGTTQLGGANGAGAVFAITTGGKLQTLHSFNYTDGASPSAELLQAANGDLYGTTASGGARNDGTVFEMTASGKLKSIYDFCAAANCPDGSGPIAGLIRGTDGNLYGTTSAGGTNFRGTVFEVTEAGKLKTLYNFCSKTSCTDGENPYGGVVQASDGTLYGTTYNGGDLTCSVPFGCGTVFSLSQ
jgi:uncharacterized repeat protein (TIGR03803 family)